MENNKLFTVAKAFFSEKEYDKAMDVCLDILAKDKDDLQTRKLMADIYFHQEDRQISKELLRQLRKENPMDFDISYRYSLVLISLGELDKAKKILGSLKRSSSDSDHRALVCSELSNIFYHQGDYKKALENMQEAIDSAIEKGAYYQALIRLLYLTEDYDKAENIYSEFLQKKDNIDFDKLLIAKINIKAEKLDIAMQILDDIKEKNHKLQSFALKALIYYLKDDKTYREQLEKIFTGIYRNSEELFLLENLMLLFVKLEEYTFASQLVEKMLEKIGEENEVRLKGILVFLYELSEKHEKAKEIALENWEPIVLSGVNYLFEANLLEQAKILIEKIKENLKENAKLYVLESMVYRRLEQIEKSLFSMRTAHEINKEDVDIIIQLAELEYVHGDIERAEILVKNIYERELDNNKKGFVHELYGDIINSSAAQIEDVDISEYEKAYREYNKVKALDHFFLFKYIETLMAKSMFGEAISLIDMHQDENSGEDWDFLRARIELELNGSEASIKILDDIIKRSSDYFRAIIQKALILKDEGNIEEAHDILEDLTKKRELPMEVLDQVLSIMDDIDGFGK